MSGKRLRSVLPLIAALLLASCGPQETPRSTEAEAQSAPLVEQEPVRAELRAAVDRLAASLRGHLVEALESGGPEQAVGVCSELAPALAAEISGDGLVVGRISDRARNPANAPDAREREWLARLAERRAGGVELSELFIPFEEDGREGLAYLRPITVGAPCLACHGAPDQIAPAVREMLAELYPEDRATGYAAGDLRGAFVATITPEG